MLNGVFAVSGMLTALAGALLAYSLAATAPDGLSDALAPAIAAAIIGGVSTTGCVLLLCPCAGLSAANAPPYVQPIITGLVLLGMALADARDLRQHLFEPRRALGRSRA